MGQEITNKPPRWEDYVCIDEHETSAFMAEHFSNENGNLLFVLGKGFDVRMNFGLSKLLAASPKCNLEIMSIAFDEGANSPSFDYQHLIDSNEIEFQSLIADLKVEEKKINVWEKTRGKKRRVGDRQASSIFTKKEQLEPYTDIVVDISSLPRGIYFSLIGKILSLIDHYFEGEDRVPNLMVLTSENAEIDSLIVEKEIDEDIHYPHGFGGGVELESQNSPTVWLPLLGENKSVHFEKAHDLIKPNEVCPLLPFPSKNPRRSDSIYNEHSELFSDVVRVDSQNLMFVHEQNPFEVYQKLIKTIGNYKNSLSVLNGSKSIISTFSSKLLSIGALLTVYEFRKSNTVNVGISNIDAFGYEIKDEDAVKKLKDSSGVFVSWLTGNIYK